jgi:diphthamide synthase subunit DPH2
MELHDGQKKKLAMVECRPELGLCGVWVWGDFLFGDCDVTCVSKCRVSGISCSHLVVELNTSLLQPTTGITTINIQITRSFLLARCCFATTRNLQDRILLPTIQFAMSFVSAQFKPLFR